MKIKHVTTARQFDTKTLKQLFALTDKLKSGRYTKDALSGKIMATLFYEPSTRTRLSFESAMLRLGGSVIATENAGQFSSATKGETLEDTVRITSSYCDVIVLRHFKAGASQLATHYSSVPIISAGDGNGEHPTQALLDLYTILSKVKNKAFTIAAIGDLVNGRTIHSLAYLLSLYPKVKIIFVAPRALKIPQDLRNHLRQKKINFAEIADFKKGLSQSDVIYQTRIQKERFQSQKEYKKYIGLYIIDKKSLRYVKANAIILHPLPRVGEIAHHVDSDPRAVYFEQAQNGLYLRMALLLSIFDKY